MPENVLLIH